jgi:hypothetical protein
MPEWMKKHPCSSCETGYGQCSQFWTHSLMCCKNCDHPTRREPNPWTLEEYEEMWEGKDPPKMVLDAMERMRNNG